MSNFQGNQGTGNTGKVGIGEKLKDAVTPGTHSTQGYTGVPGNNPQLGTGNSGSGTGSTGSGYGNQGNQQGGSTGTGGYNTEGVGNNRTGAQMGPGGAGAQVAGHGVGVGNQGGQGGGLGGSAGGPQEHYEKKTHNTSDHQENESFETSTRN